MGAVLESFGYGHVSFTGLLVIGRSASSDNMKRTRLRWRSDKVLIDSNTVICVTFDDVHEILRKRYALYKAAASLEKSLADSPNTPPPEMKGGIGPV